MESLIVENVRCFRKRQEVPLAPLTILVGENSTGKSTFLALVRLAWDLAAGKLPLDFNEEPFLLGAFNQIATTRRGKMAQTGSFVLGGCFEFLEPGEEVPSSACLTGEFRSTNGQPNLASVSLRSGDRSLSAGVGEHGTVSELRYAPPGAEVPRDIAIAKDEILARYLRFRPDLRGLFELLDAESERRKRPNLSGPSLYLHLVGIANKRGIGFRHRPFAFAPIRTRPLRTYDPIRDTPGPEGTHVPVLLAQTYMQDVKSASRLREAVEEFGKASSLFSSLQVRQLGDSSSDPFQLQITVDSLPVNIMDVGYGVSQALPIVVDCLRGPNQATFLLQQPEVHLHPRAQAELGTFLSALTQTRKQRFVIETHSDYLVDRVRMDIRDGKTGLRPEDVSLLYFERKNGEVEIVRIHIDSQGNLVDPPAGYRRFFLEEERRFLGGL